MSGTFFKMDGTTVIEMSKDVEEMIFPSSPLIYVVGNGSPFEGIVKLVDLSQTQAHTINIYAFGNCYNLKEVYFPNTLKIIQSNAFLRTKLTVIQIPPLVETMTGYAWNQIVTIEKFEVNPANQHFSSDQGYLFDFHKTKLVCAPRSLESEQNIPNINTITAIGEYCFTESNLLTFTCPQNIQTIETRAFHVMRYLLYIDLSKSQVTSLPTDLFNTCGKLYIIKLPFTLEDIQINAFDDLPKLQRIIIYPYVTNISPSSFTDCPILNSILFFGKSNFANIEMSSGTTQPTKVTVYVTQMYRYENFGTMKITTKPAGFLFSCNKSNIFPVLPFFIPSFISQF